MKQYRWRLVLLVLIGAATGLGVLTGPAANGALVCDTSWNNPAGGDWFVGGNWTAGVPNGGTNTCINLAGTYTVTMAATGSTNGFEIGNPNATLSINPVGSIELAMGANSTNAGTINLTGAANDARLHTLGATVLTNTGTIRSVAAAGGSRTFNLFLQNDPGGVIAIDRTTGMINGSVLTNNGGAITVATGQQLTGSGETLDNAAGSITSAGTGEVSLTSSTIKMGSGTTSGNPLRLIGGTLSFTGTGNGAVIVNQSVSHSGNIAAGQTVFIEGVASSSAEMTSTAPYTNAGTINLTGAANDARLHTLGATVLTNTGTIRSVAAAGGSRTFNLFLQNDPGGVIAIDRTTGMINGSVLTNNGGAITVATGQQLTGSGETLDNAAGSITSAGTGEVSLTSTTIKMGSGTTSGNPLRLIGGTLSFTGTGNGAVIVNQSVSHSGNIAAGQTVFIEGVASSSAEMTSTAPYTNAGTINLTGAANDARLHTLGATVLTNTGTIRSVAAAGGSRTFNLFLQNDPGGVIAIDRTTGMINGSVLTNNGGAITVATGQQLTGSGETLDNAAGSITSAGTGEVSLTSSTIKMGSGTTSGNPLRLIGGTLSFTGTGNGAVIVNQSVSHSGNIAAGQTVFIDADGASNATLSYGSPFTNAGTVRLTASANIAVLDANGPGSITNTPTGSLLVDQGTGGGRFTDSPIINHGVFQPGKGGQGLQSSWTFDQASAPAGSWTERIDSLTVFDHASFGNTVDLGGTMAITSAVTPALGTTIPNVITGSSIAGTFATVSQTLFSGTLGWTPVYFPTHVDLVVADLGPPAAPTATIAPDPINLANRTNIGISGSCLAGAAVNYTLADAGSAHTLMGSMVCPVGAIYSFTGLNLTPFNDGTITGTVTQTNGNGTSPPGADSAFKDTIAPTLADGSVNITPAFINAANVAAVSYTGTCVSGNGVVLTATDQHAQSVAVASFTCGAGGTYHATFNATSFTEGDTVTLSAVQADPAGNPGPPNTDTAVKDTTAPALAEGSVDITPTTITAANLSAVPYTGTCVSGNGVVVTTTDQHAHSVAVASFACAAGGTYGGNFNATSFTEGDIVTLSAFQTDPAGNVGPANTDTATKTTVVPTADPCTITITGNRTSPVAVYSGQFFCIYNANVSAAVSVFPGGGVAIRQSTIGGGVSANGATSVTACGSQLLSISATNSSGRVQIGGDSRPNCPPNTMSGGVQLSGNQAGVELSGNQIGGTVGVTNNAGGTEISGNKINSTLSCSGNNPPPTNAGQPNTASAKSGQCVAL